MESNPGPESKQLLSSKLLGQRVVVRYLLEGQVGPTGGPAYTDALGILEAWQEDSITIRRPTGTLTKIPRSTIVAGKGIPPPPQRRHSGS